MDYNEIDFSGVFYFTNVTKEDFKVLWNNKEYEFPSGKTVPLIIMGEPLENIQEIRKKFAYKLAVREFYKSKEYNRLRKMGNGIPPTYDEKILEPWIEECLKPLPIAKAKVREGKKDSDKNYKSTKAMGIKDDPNYLFREETQKTETLGKMPDSLVA